MSRLGVYDPPLFVQETEKYRHKKQHRDYRDVFSKKRPVSDSPPEYHSKKAEDQTKKHTKSKYHRSVGPGFQVKSEIEHWKLATFYHHSGHQRSRLEVPSSQSVQRIQDSPAVDHEIVIVGTRWD